MSHHAAHAAVATCAEHPRPPALEGRRQSPPYLKGGYSLQRIIDTNRRLRRARLVAAVERGKPISISLMHDVVHFD
jgi:hypothetical protein